MYLPDSPSILKVEMELFTMASKGIKRRKDLIG